MKKSHFEVAIIGGGVIGCMTALSLRKRGCKVAVLEKNQHLANEASRAGGGIISPLHPWRYSQAMLNLASWSHQQFPELVHELSSLSGVDVPLIKTGMLVPNTEEAEAEAALACSFLSSRVLQPEQVFAVEPGIHQPQQSVFVDDVHNIRNPALCRALPIALQRLGVEVKTQIEIESIKKHNEGYEITSKEQVVSADKVVVCAGAWSSQVLSICGLDESTVPEIFPVKGQMLAYKATLGVLRTVILEQNRYLIPRHDGIVVVGSTVENAEFDKQKTPAALAELRAFAENMLPALAHYPVISHWAGLRPGSHRDKPVICEVEHSPGLYMSIGHFRNGLLSAPASAQVLVDIVFNQASEFDLHSYAI